MNSERTNVLCDSTSWTLRGANALDNRRPRVDPGALLGPLRECPVWPVLPRAEPGRAEGAEEGPVGKAVPALPV